MEDLREFAYAGFKNNDCKILCAVQHIHLDRLEVHYLIPRVSAESGLYFNPFPPNYNGQKGPGSNEVFKRHNDFFVDYICSKYGLQSPRSPELKRKIKTPSFEDNNTTRLRQKVADQINLRIESGEIISRDDMFKFLGRYHGEISRCGEDYFSVKFPSARKAVRLKGEIYGSKSAQAIKQNRFPAIKVEIPVSVVEDNYYAVVKERAEKVESRHGKRTAENSLEKSANELDADLNYTHEALGGNYNEIDSMAIDAVGYIKENLFMFKPTVTPLRPIDGVSFSVASDKPAAENRGDNSLDKIFAHYISWKKGFLKQEAKLYTLRCRQAVLSYLRAKSHSIDFKMSIFTGYNFVEPGKRNLTVSDARYYNKIITSEVISAKNDMITAARKEAERQAWPQAVQAGDHMRDVEQERNLRQAVAEIRQWLGKERWKGFGGPSHR